jgi:hypothetical protein
LALLSSAPARAAEGQWRSAASAAQAAAPSSPAAANEDEATRSVVVRRNGAQVARTPSPNREFDPFDEADELMPAVEPTDSALAPALEPAHDPFDDLAAAPAVAAPYDPFDDAPASTPDPEEPAVDEAPATPEEHAAPDIQDAFDEPTSTDDREAARPEAATLGDEMVESELKGEVAAPGPKAEVIISEPPIVTESAPLEDELAAPGLDGEFDLPLDSLGGSPLDLDSDTQLQPTPEQLEERRRQLDLQREKSEARCQDLVEAVRGDSLRSISLDISVSGNPGEDFPFECRAVDRPFQGRNWSQVTYMWKASALCHKPLYFEQVQVERYGHSWGPALQPIMSGAHFFATIPILPYKMGLETPNECIYTLGYYRPGDCAPYMIPAFPFTWRAAAFQAGFATGAAVVVP